MQIKGKKYVVIYLMTDHGNYIVEGEEAVALDLGVHVLTHRTAGQQPNL